jgi:hypothetical protein
LLSYSPMSQSVELSDTLISDARSSAELSDRSVAGQIEFWARLGKTFASSLRLDEAEAVKQSGAVKSVSECLNDVDTPYGRQLLKETLSRKPYPHFEPVLDRPGYWVRIESDGTRTSGKFVGRTFVVES